MKFSFAAIVATLAVVASANKCIPRPTYTTTTDIVTDTEVPPTDIPSSSAPEPSSSDDVPSSSDGEPQPSSSDEEPQPSSSDEEPQPSSSDEEPQPSSSDAPTDTNTDIELPTITAPRPPM
ncbi:hypothetical protein H4R99_004093 [Coemansia sp. RSA 1722]|nr:hypothetical protein H4R99_004093 [Coemansia sp. RSA 1722]